MNTKILITILLCTFIVTNTHAQSKEYKTFIYTSDDLAEEIRLANDSQDDTRRFDIDLLNSTLLAARGIGSGYVTSFIDMGITALGNLITKNSRQKKEWEETVKNENKWTTTISTVQDIKDFYRKPSTAGALDPMNMSFDGIGCLRMEGKDTTFFISCHIDRDKLNRIINHSKFELVLDTLILSPFHSNLPNSPLPLTFSFDERGNFNLNIDIRLTSSWFTDAIELHTDELLGKFNINIPVAPDDLGSDGYLRYIRREGQPSQYAMTGESFIIPRSFMGYRDSSGRYNNIWGTGQYKLDLTITETCGMTEQFASHWKEDRKKRNKLAKNNSNFFSTVWKSVTSQHWDEITKSWVITTVSAPAGLIKKEVNTIVGGVTTDPTQAGATQKIPPTTAK